MPKLFSSSSTSGPVVHREAEAHEHVDDLVAHARDRVRVAERARAGAPGSVRSKGGALSSASRAARARARRRSLERGLDLLLERVDQLADGLALLGRDGAHLLEDRRQLALLAEDLGVLVAQRLLGRRRLEARAERGAQGRERALDGGGSFAPWSPRRC